MAAAMIRLLLATQSRLAHRKAPALASQESGLHRTIALRILKAAPVTAALIRSSNGMTSDPAPAAGAILITFRGKTTREEVEIAMKSIAEKGGSPGMNTLGHRLRIHEDQNHFLLIS